MKTSFRGGTEREEEGEGRADGRYEAKSRTRDRALGVRVRNR